MAEQMQGGDRLIRSFFKRIWCCLALLLIMAGSSCSNQDPDSSNLKQLTRNPGRSLFSPKRFIYLKAGADWQPPRVWYWFADKTPSGLGDWPGSAVMEALNSPAGWYRFVYDGEKSWAGFLFNGGALGAQKSGDINAAGSGCYVIITTLAGTFQGNWYDLNTERCPFNPFGDTVSGIEVGADREGGSFASEALSVSLRVKGQKLVGGGGKYTVDDSDPATSASARPFVSGDRILVGDNMAVGSRIPLKLYAVDAKGESTRAEFVYNKIKGAYQERENLTLLQGFHWYIKNPIRDDSPYQAQPEPESNLWEYIAKEKAEEFYLDGFSHVWLPPSGKAFISNEEDAKGEFNVGYAIYDHYDLGEFFQSSHIRTKYGTKKQLVEAVDALHQRKIKVVADIVMNHMLGTDNMQEVDVEYGYVTDNYYIEKNDPVTFYKNKDYNVAKKRINDGKVKAFLNFDFANTLDVANGGVIGPRRDVYSDFKWRAEHFTGMEVFGTYYLFKGKNVGFVNVFPDMPPGSPGDYRQLRSDVILGSDIDLSHPEVSSELKRWTQWLVKEVGFDGFRVDAVRHMDMNFLVDWAGSTQRFMSSIGKGKGMLMFGENWDGWNERLYAFLIGKGTANEYNPQNPGSYAGIDSSMSLFDVPLHYDFQKIAGVNIEFKDISELPESGLLAKAPDKTITFVDNHDTDPTQKLASYIPLHTKLQAYTYILLNTKGIPCVYYRDMYKGNALPAEARDPYANTDFAYLNRSLKDLIRLRNEYVFGNMTYYKGRQILGAKISGRKGNGGLVYLIRNHGGSATTLDIPTDGTQWVLAAGNGEPEKFKLKGDWAVWVHK